MNIYIYICNVCEYVSIKVYIYTCIYIGMYTGKPLSLPAPTPTTCPNIKKHCVLWDKMHMSMIMAFILQRTA